MTIVFFFNLSYASYIRRYLLPELVCTTVPFFAPFFTGDVEIFCPTLNTFELLIFPVMEPSGFCLHWVSTGIPSFFTAVFFLGAGLARGAGLATALGVALGAGFDKFTVARPNAGFFAGAVFLAAGAGAGAGAFGLDAPPKKEKEFVGLEAGAGAGGGDNSFASFWSEAALFPKSEKVPTFGVDFFGAGAGGGDSFCASFWSEAAWFPK
eukprot:CAMPEP_0203716438 /NCGR_PEP_ID=MMETSP0092-20131115/1089_1 /ASSEMBLY_ACC=CAM_ASM_001090 /TAXON_ID=426623 /ORGANISM="Chaetoceros affinis, Strain CCMP159" /LENGTH=208 /DNA_ID=CAMNT_0050594985 /DNA_START=178 /DNA_END=801 /DNA_ORIENTATION=-